MANSIHKGVFGMPCNNCSSSWVPYRDTDILKFVGVDFNQNTGTETYKGAFPWPTTCPGLNTTAVIIKKNNPNRPILIPFSSTINHKCGGNCTIGTKRANDVGDSVKQKKTKTNKHAWTMTHYCKLHKSCCSKCNHMNCWLFSHKNCIYFSKISSHQLLTNSSWVRY